MPRLALLPPLLAALLLGACGDLTGLGGRSLEGEWSARIEGEEVWVSLRDDRGEIWGSGEWGWDEVYVTGERIDSDVYLIFEFHRYSPIELEGVIVSREIDGRLYGSGLEGERVRFRRE
jgi:hypothetical protein